MTLKAIVRFMFRAVPIVWMLFSGCLVLALVVQALRDVYETRGVWGGASGIALVAVLIAGTTAIAAGVDALRNWAD